MNQKFLILQLFLFFSSINYAQNSKEETTYFDADGKETTKENCFKYRVMKELMANDFYNLYDLKYYYKSGELMMEGSSLSKESETRTGDFIYYYENGNKKRKEHYGKKLMGECQEWYEDGTKKSIGEYFESKEGMIQSYFKLYQYWTPDGTQTVINSNGFYESNANDSSESGSIKNGEKDGEWKGNLYKDKLKYVETYKIGKLVSGTSTDYENKKYEYKVLESKPEPKNGMNDFYEYIAKNFKKPDELENISGRILIQFTVNKEGGIIEPKILKSLHPALDMEAIRLLFSYNKWISAKHRGRNISVLYYIPLNLQ